MKLIMIGNYSCICQILSVNQVVSNNVGGILDYRRDNFAELLPVGDVEGMSNAVLRLADAPKEKKKRGILARSFAQQNLIWERIAVQTLKVYSKVLSK